VAGVAAPVVVQHQSLVNLRQQNEALRQQADQAAQLSEDNERLSNLVTQASNSLSDEQHRELLRLRGEVGQLRAQAKEIELLKKANQQFQAAVARMREGSQNQTADTDSEQPTPAQRVSYAKMNDAKRLALGLLLHENDYTNQFVTSLEQIQPYLGTNQLTGTNQFELVYQGFLRDVANPAQGIVLKETQAWPAPDGSGWRKTYAFADGHCEVHAAPDGSFDAWEKEHTASFRATQ
jgi:hypothetical protein